MLGNRFPASAGSDSFSIAPPALAAGTDSFAVAARTLVAGFPVLVARHNANHLHHLAFLIGRSQGCSRVTIRVNPILFGSSRWHSFRVRPQSGFLEKIMNAPTYFHSTALQQIASLVAHSEPRYHAPRVQAPPSTRPAAAAPQNLIPQGKLQTQTALKRHFEDWLWQHTMGTWLAQFQARKILNGEYAQCDEARRILMGSIKNDRKAWADRLQCAATLNNAGNCSYYEGNLKEALELYKLALSAANQDENAIDSPILRGIIHNLSVVSAKLGSHRSARLYRAAIDSTSPINGIAWVVTKTAILEFSSDK